ncbi:hypothetical protein PF007_g20438 [Phytophthora fragariae]|uniref:Uncharacterized protein n=1 Tax=Phytophthora fragariae TaxID=53985 RepID=A0A6A3R5Q0_9STRA|nr:hypothetical protein PF003_g25667 [Phytophthora fragariae]KAE8928454.1 hypothetical protein PF009_g21404 [Phytophthora fragariae]KAE9087272.1 hypothetical protein PF007_g20438 [Phytophthora fragariae]
MVERSVDAGKLPEADVEDEDEDEDVEDDKNALGLGMAKGALSVAKKTEYDCDDAETSEVRSKVDCGSKEMAAATEADASEREDTAETEAHRHGTVVDHHLSRGPVDRVRVTIPGLRRPSADELRRKVEVRLAAYVDAIEHPTQATRDVKSETDG